jgi:hypothetical protein
MSLQDAASVSELRGTHGKHPGSREQAHVGVGVRGHVRMLEWKTRYDESGKLFDENLQNS